MYVAWDFKHVGPYMGFALVMNGLAATCMNLIQHLQVPHIRSIPVSKVMVSGMYGTSLPTLEIAAHPDPRFKIQIIRHFTEAQMEDKLFLTQRTTTHNCLTTASSRLVGLTCLWKRKER